MSVTTLRLAVTIYSRSSFCLYYDNLIFIVTYSIMSVNTLLKESWRHIKANHLQLARNPSMIRPDAKLASMVGSKDISILELPSALHRYVLMSRAPRETERAKKLNIPYFPHL